MNFFILLISTSLIALANEKSVEIIAEDGKFTPSNIELKSSDIITLVIVNKGKDAEEFESIDLKKEKIVLPGKTIKVKIGSLKPGVYKFFGDFHPMTAQGLIKIIE
jgi:hypothetical protein